MVFSSCPYRGIIFLGDKIYTCRKNHSFETMAGYLFEKLFKVTKRMEVTFFEKGNIFGSFENRLELSCSLTIVKFGN